MYHQGHYVYRHLTPDGRTIYVGIGQAGRAYELKGRDKYHGELIMSYTHDYVEFEAVMLTKEEAVCLERKIIRLDDPICNIQGRVK